MKSSKDYLGLAYRFKLFKEEMGSRQRHNFHNAHLGVNIQHIIISSGKL